MRTILIALGNTSGAIFAAQVALSEMPNLNPLLVSTCCLLFFLGLTIAWCWKPERERG